MEAIRLEFQYTEAEAVRAVVEVTKSTSKAIAAMPWIGGSLVAMAKVYWLTQGADVADFSVLLLFGALLMFVPVVTVWNAKRDFRKNLSANMTVRWEIDQEWLRNQTQGIEAKFTWEKLIEVVERRSGVLLVTQKRLAHWIPKEAFGSENEMERFRRLVRDDGIEYTV